MWILFAAFTPFLYTITNFIDKYILEKKIKDPVAATIFGSFVSSLIGLSIWAFLKFPRLDLFQTGVLLGAGILLVIYLIPYYSALRMEDTSTVVPLFQFVPVFVLVLAWTFLHEKLTLVQLAGFMLVLIGGYTLSVKSLSVSVFTPRPILFLMLLSSFLYASVLVIVRAAMKAESYWVVMSYEMMGGGIGALLLLFFVGKQRFVKVLKEIFSIFGIIGANNGIAISAQLSEGYALSLAPSSLVSIVGGVQPLFLVSIGFLLTTFFPRIIREDISPNILRKKIFSMVFIAVGISLIYLP